ncbi:MAG: hypothetical protein JW929_15085 [Anaerolineales bacterium]|nr:hypothetical protein [Anaerolineales bacterium]
MLSMLADGIPVFFDEGDRDAGELMMAAVAQSLRVIRESWGLAGPEDCRVYVMTAWPRFIFQSAPWSWRILLAVTFPFWFDRARRMWPYSAGWTQRYGRRTAIGIKPLRLLEAADKSVGLHMYEEEKDPPTKIRHILCHELTHACSAHLQPPAWLNEGLAMVAVDRYLQKNTIRTDTLELIRNARPKAAPPTYREMSRLHGRELAYHAVRGYWMVRYLEETRPGFLRRLLSAWPGAAALNSRIALELGLDPAELWIRIDGQMAEYFEDRADRAKKEK